MRANNWISYIVTWETCVRYFFKFSSKTEFSKIYCSINRYALYWTQPSQINNVIVAGERSSLLVFKSISKISWGKALRNTKLVIVSLNCTRSIDTSNTANQIAAFVNNHWYRFLLKRDKLQKKYLFLEFSVLWISFIRCCTIIAVRMLFGLP